MASIDPRRRLVLVYGVAFAAAGGRASGAVAPVRVASKIDTEGLLLGHLILLALEAQGIRTENRLQLGATAIVRAALLAGEVDIYPEYTGNGAIFLADEGNPAWKDARKGYERVRALDRARNGLVWLAPAPANNTWAIAIRKDVAARNGLKTLDDFARWVRAGATVKLAASAEFVERPDALPAFQASYGFVLRQDQLLALAGGDTAVTVKAAAEQTAGVNAAMAYGTDGPLAALGLVILQDNRGVQVVYAPAPVVRANVLALVPGIGPALAPVFSSLDGTTLQELNAQIALEGEDARQVAAAYLRARGLLR